MTSRELQAVLLGNSRNAMILLGDSNYDHLRLDALPVLRNRSLDIRRQEGLITYEEENNDCENFSIYQTSDWAKMNGLRKSAGALPLAMGMVWFYQQADQSRPHSVGWAVTEDAGLYYIEPQPNTSNPVWEPDYSEAQSAWFYLSV